MCLLSTSCWIILNIGSGIASAHLCVEIKLYFKKGTHKTHFQLSVLADHDSRTTRQQKQESNQSRYSYRERSVDGRALARLCVRKLNSR